MLVWSWCDIFHNTDPKCKWSPSLSLYPGHDPSLFLHRPTLSSLCWVWITPTWPAWDDWSEWSLSKRWACSSSYNKCFWYENIFFKQSLIHPFHLYFSFHFHWLCSCSSCWLWLYLQLRKAIEGSVTVTGVKVRPPLASFRDCGNSTSVSEVTELHKLCIRHRGLSLPREPNPPDVEEQPDLPYKEIPVNFSDTTNLQLETSPGDATSPSSELVLQESPSFTEDQSEFTFDCSPSHTEESELACDYDLPAQTPELDQTMEQEEQGSPSSNKDLSEPEGEGSPVHTEDQSEWSEGIHTVASWMLMFLTFVGVTLTSKSSLDTPVSNVVVAWVSEWECDI